MKLVTVKYALKGNKNSVYLLTVKAVDEKDARRVAYNKIDNRVYVLI